MHWATCPLERIIFDPWPGTATEADLLRLLGQDRACELIDGTLVEKPAGYWESVIAANLVTILGAFVRSRQLGIVSGADSTMRMASSGRIRLPDVAFISMARSATSLDAIPTVSPDLAVEVLSSSNTGTEINQKLSDYFESGTRLCWIIDPRARTVAVLHSVRQARRRASSVKPIASTARTWCAAFPLR